MKKNVYLFFVAIAVLTACNSNNKPAPAAGNSVQVVDTTKMHSTPQQAADTNIKDGTFIKKYPNGIIKEKSYYAAGRRQGECQSFYENGKLWSDDFFTAGVLDGPTSSYYENGQKRYDGNYIKGKPSGTWIFFDDKGKQVRTVNYGKKIDKPVM